MRILTNMLPTRKRRRKPRRSARAARYETVIAHPAAQSFPLGLAVRWLWSRLASVAFLAGIGGLLFWFFWSYDFYVYSADVQGNNLLSSDTVFAQSGLEGYNIFFVDTDEVTRRIGALPAVKGARVAASLPNRVVVELEERTPVAVWETQGERYWVDREGIFFPLRSAVPTDTLVIRDLDNRAVSLGPPEGDNAELPDATPVLTALELNSYLPEQRAMDFSQDGGISFVATGGWHAYFGDWVGLQAKVAIYQAFIEKRAPYLAVEYLDLSIPGQPYYKKRVIATPVPATEP